MMKFLQELVSFKRMDDDVQDEDLLDDDSFDDEYDDAGAEDFGDEPPEEDDLGEFDGEDPEVPPEADFDLEGGAPAGDEPDAEFNDEMGDEFGEEGMEDMPEDEPTEPEDPDRAGLIRTVNKAHLVYKRSTDDGTYEELWMYNISNLRNELSIRKAILSGTDIPPNRSQSPDGSQSYELWTSGNAEMMLVKGLPQ